MSRLIILHTNDLHSQFENMPKIAASIRKYRSKFKADELLVVDCGDHMDRMRYETEGSAGEANVAVMNATGYDLIVPGNNEGLTFPKAAFESMFKGKASFAVLGTNMRELESGKVPDWMENRLIVVKGGKRIGIVGVTASYNNFYHPLGWDVEDPLGEVQKAVKAMRDQVDFLLVISHVGLRFDRLLASQTEGIDCILGGHTHHLFEQAERAGSTLICAAGKLGTHLGVVEVRFDDRTGRIVSLEGAAEPVAEEADDPELSFLIERYRDQSRKALSRQVADLHEPLDHDPLLESDLGNLLAGGIRRWTGTEIALVNAGQLLGGLPAGSQTDGDLLAICPSPINPCSLLLLGREIEEALEAALVDEVICKPVRGFGFRGNMLGTLSVSGIEVEYDRDSPNYHKIQSIRIQGGQLERERLYRVGTIDMFTFGAGYPSLGRGSEIRYFLPEFLRDILKSELTDPEAIRRSKERHFHAIS